MHLEYESQNLVLEKNRIRLTDKKYECIRKYDKNSVGGGKWKVGDVCPLISSGVDKSSQHRQKKTFKFPMLELVIGGGGGEGGGGGGECQPISPH